MSYLAGNEHTVYVVVRSDGALKWSRRAGLAIYRSKSTAAGQAKDQGDTVVELKINLKDTTPVFVRGGADG